MVVKAIVASGGSGTRMKPVTRWINKHMIPIGNDELMIDMPLKYLAKNDFKTINVVTGSNHASQICEYIEDGHQYGFDSVEYSFQVRPAGISDVLNRVDLGGDGVLLILGDNYFEENLIGHIHPDKAVAWEYDVGSIEKARAFGQYVADSIVEKPKDSGRSHILTGLYYFPCDVVEKLKNLTPSQRNELEITDLLDIYLKEHRLEVRQVVGKWFDMGEQSTWLEFMNWRNNK